METLEPMARHGRRSVPRVARGVDLVDCPRRADHGIASMEPIASMERGA